jgi:hypothetical protein
MQELMEVVECNVVKSSKIMPQDTSQDMVPFGQSHSETRLLKRTLIFTVLDLAIHRDENEVRSCPLIHLRVIALHMQTISDSFGKNTTNMTAGLESDEETILRSQGRQSHSLLSKFMTPVLKQVECPPEHTISFRKRTRT